MLLSLASQAKFHFIPIRQNVDTPPNTPPNASTKANYIRALCHAVNLIRDTRISIRSAVNYFLRLQGYIAVNPKRY